jgi:hypothetical protein
MLGASAPENLTGAIDDALLGRCALKASAETICTWNLMDFLLLPPAIASRARQPDP